MPGFSAADSFVGPQNQGNASPSGGLNPQPQTGPEDFSRVMAGYKQLHPDPQANAQLNHLASLGIQPEMIAALAKQAFAPDPQSPQPPPEKPLSVWESIAAAYHPQLLGQFKKDPMANPQFQSQMAAFQQAMTNKRSAMSDIIGMVKPDITGQYGLMKQDLANQGKETSDAINRARLDETIRHNKAMEDMRGNMDQNKWQLVYGPDGYAYWAPKPSGPPQSGKSAPASVPVGLPGGGQAGKPLNANAVGLTGALKEAGNTLNQMVNLFRKGAGYEVDPQTGNIVGKSPGLVASTGRLAASGAMALPGVRAVAGYISPEAREHEALRQKLVLELNKPVSGQQRLLQAEIKQLLEYVPSWGENPVSAEAIYKNAFEMLQQMQNKYGQAYPRESAAGSTPAVDPSLAARARAIAERNRKRVGGQ